MADPTTFDYAQDIRPLRGAFFGGVTAAADQRGLAAKQQRLVGGAVREQNAVLAKQEADAMDRERQDLALRSQRLQLQSIRDARRKEREDQAVLPQVFAELDAVVAPQEPVPTAKAYERFYGLQTKYAGKLESNPALRVAFEAGAKRLELQETAAKAAQAAQEREEQINTELLTNVLRVGGVDTAEAVLQAKGGGTPEQQTLVQAYREGLAQQTLAAQQAEAGENLDKALGQQDKFYSGLASDFDKLKMVDNEAPDAPFGSKTFAPEDARKLKVLAKQVGIAPEEAAKMDPLDLYEQTYLRLQEARAGQVAPGVTPTAPVKPSFGFDR